MMRSKPKIFVIGLDGATWKLLNPLIDKGKLPNLKKIRDGSTSGILTSTIPSISAAAWSSFQTGVNPGKHNVFNFYQRRINPDRDILINSQSIKARKIQSYFSEHGIKYNIINLPVTYPIEPGNGISISSFLTPEKAEDYFYPLEIYSILKKYGYRIDTSYEKSFPDLPQHYLNPNQINKILNDVKGVIRARTQTFLHLIKQYPADFNFIYYKATDFIQHLFYDTKPAQEIWQFLDRDIGRILAQFKKIKQKDKYLFVISDHGFHPTATLAWSPYVWFNNLNENTKSSMPAYWRFGSYVASRFKKFGINPSHLKAIASLRQKAVGKVDADLKHRSLQENNFLPTIEGLYLFGNLRETTQVNKLMQSLKSLTYESSPIFSYVGSAHETYQGNYVTEAPDIVWIFNQRFTLNFSLISDQEVSRTQPNLKGEHFSDPNGILSIMGKGVRPKFHGEEIGNLMDLLPTFLGLYGVTLDEHFDGKFLSDIFTEVEIKAHQSRDNDQEDLLSDISL